MLLWRGVPHSFDTVPPLSFSLFPPPPPWFAVRLAERVYVNTMLSTVNAWTAEEKATFLKRYLQTPKDFAKIAKHLPRKSVQECVLFYYRSKYQVGYKAKLEQLRKERNQKRRKKVRSALVRVCVNMAACCLGFHTFMPSSLPSSLSSLPLSSRPLHQQQNQLCFSCGR